jgi:hypothetical protein
MEYFGPRGVSRCPLGRKKKKFEYEGEYEYEDDFRTRGRFVLS